MRKIIIVLAACIALLLLGFTGYRGYVVWKQSHGLAMAKAYFAKADLNDTYLSLQQVLKANPSSLEACRMMAHLLDMERSPTALIWHQRVLELNPKSLEDRLALAEAAIIHQEYSLATNALAGAGDAEKKTAPFQNMAGTVALVGGHLDEAETHFSEALRLDPSNPSLQLNLAVVRLHRTNVLDMAEARISLQRVIMTSTNVVLRNQARRELIGDAMRSKDNATAITLAGDLVQETNSAFADKLLQLEVLRKTQSPQFQSMLKYYQNKAAGDPAAIADLAKWQAVNVSMTSTRDWLQQLPQPMQTNQTVEILLAGCKLQLSDWRGLESAIEHQDWNDAQHPWNDMDFMRHAYLARCLREQGLAEASSAEWEVAVKSAGDQKYVSVVKSSFKMLFSLAASWKWNTEGEQVLWAVVKQFPDEKWAFPVLRQALIEWHRTQSLMQLFDIMIKRDANDLTTKNDLATIALLLGAQEAKPYDLAREVHQKAPNNPYFASTYAFSLYQQKQYGGALKVMQQLTSPQLQDPSIAGYYGLILKANGNKAEAKAYLNRISKATLLPEEQALFDQAKQGL